MIKYLRYFKKWKIAVFAAFIMVAPGCLFTPNPYGLANAVISFIISLVIAVGPLVPDYLYLKTPAKKFGNAGNI